MDQLFKMANEQQLAYAKNQLRKVNRRINLLNLVQADIADQLVEAEQKKLDNEYLVKQAQDHLNRGKLEGARDADNGK